MGNTLNNSNALTLARHVLQTEADALIRLSKQLDHHFIQALDLIRFRHGRVIVSGIGKSGHIARKIAATLASTGTPAYFVHAAEAAHGDLGMITGEDILIAISNSGEGEELLTIVPLIKRQGGKLIAMTSHPNSSLAREADVHLNLGVTEEACPLNLAPTASTTTALALGDALAVALLAEKGFSVKDFAHSHPGGTLGRQLLIHVSDVMRPFDKVPIVTPETSFGQAVLTMSSGGMGMIAIISPEKNVIGVFTDGDLRRALDKVSDFRSTKVSEIMTLNPKTIEPGKLAVEAARMMEEFRITQILVVEDAMLVGALNTHDLLRAKVI